MAGSRLPGTSDLKASEPALREARDTVPRAHWAVLGVPPGKGTGFLGPEKALVPLGTPGTPLAAPGLGWEPQAVLQPTCLSPQNPDIVLVHYLNVPAIEDCGKPCGPILCSINTDKKEWAKWTKEELIGQLKPMCE